MVCHAREVKDQVCVHGGGGRKHLLHEIMWRGVMALLPLVGRALTILGGAPIPVSHVRQPLS